MKKRILFVIPSFRIGGTIVSLDSLLSVIDTDSVCVDIFALSKEGDYLQRLHNCNVLPENVWLSSKIINGSHCTRVTNFILRGIKKLLNKLGFTPMPYYGRRAGATMQTYKYDAIVSYQEDLISFVSYLPAKKKIAWIHSDYARYKTLNSNVDETRYYQLVDKVVCVSEYSRKKFAECIPSAAHKSCSIHNIINVDEIRRKAVDDSDLMDSAFDTSYFTIVSAGRLDPVKQFEKIPLIAQVIKKYTQLPFRWYIIGGSRGFEWLEKEINDSIVDKGVRDCVLRLSEKSNIYPYISKANIYVSTSLSESFPLVVEEAKALGIPPVINNFGSSNEIVCDDVDGFIVPLEKMGERIASYINDQQIIVKVREYLLAHPYNNQEIIEKISHLFD